MNNYGKPFKQCSTVGITIEPSITEFSTKSQKIGEQLSMYKPWSSEIWEIHQQLVLDSQEMPQQVKIYSMENT